MSNAPQPNNDDLVGGSLTGTVIFAAVVIAVLSDHPVNVPYLYVGPVIMLIVWLFTRNKDVNGILVAGGFLLALIITMLAIWS